ncbi:MAG: GTP-binding protein [Pseudomonadota bacterium]|nr:GTP-binding protein [Pseudomonadota bacterium]
MSSYKIVFAGPVGAGKTTAIGAISDIEPFQTEEVATDETRELKENTTVAMDYGLMKLDGGERIHLYGTPGQERFSFMWEILSDGALGLVLLINNLDRNPIAVFENYIDAFSDYIVSSCLAVGITRMDPGTGPGIDDYQQVLANRSITAPVLDVDPRVPSDVILLTEALLFNADPGIE